MYEDDDYWTPAPVGSKNKNVDPSIHVMNKDEKTALRKLKHETGLSEEELRKEKKYRKILSDAQVSGTKSKDSGAKLVYQQNKDAFRYLKRLLVEVGLPLEHPTIKEKFKIAYDQYPRWRSGGRSIGMYIAIYPRVKKYIKYYKSVNLL